MSDPVTSLTEALFYGFILRLRIKFNTSGWIFKHEEGAKPVEVLSLYTHLSLTKFCKLEKSFFETMNDIVNHADVEEFDRLILLAYKLQIPENEEDDILFDDDDDDADEKKKKLKKKQPEDIFGKRVITKVAKTQEGWELLKDFFTVVILKGAQKKIMDDDELSKKLMALSEGPLEEIAEEDRIKEQRRRG